MSEYCSNCAGVAERYEDQVDRLDKRILALEAELAIMTKDRDSLLESVRRTTVQEVADQIQAQRTALETGVTKNET